MGDRLEFLSNKVPAPPPLDEAELAKYSDRSLVPWVWGVVHSRYTVMEAGILAFVDGKLEASFGEDSATHRGHARRVLTFDVEALFTNPELP